MRLWRPIELVAYLLFSTIWRGHPVHCNVEIDGLIYDNSLDDGIQVLEKYPLEPWQSVVASCQFKEMKLVVARSLARERHPKWPAILDSLGIWPKGLKVPYTCVSLSCILLGLPILKSRRPVHLLRRLTDGSFRFTKSITAAATVTAGHVGAGRNKSAQETREG